MLNGNSMYFYVFWELIYFYVICIYVIRETTEFSLFRFDMSCRCTQTVFVSNLIKFTFSTMALCSDGLSLKHRDIAFQTVN